MDFVISEKHREVCVSTILNILTSFLRCKFVDLTFSEDSATLAYLQKSCEEHHIYFRTKQSWFGGHRIIPVTSTWNDFVKTKNKKFRDNIRRAEQKIKALGNCRVYCVDNINRDPKVCEKILKIWEHSWKKEWLTRKGIAYDPELAVALNALRETEQNSSLFKWKAYFIELNNIPIAFDLIFMTNGTAFLKRGSYNNFYKKFFPGFFLDNYVIQDLFNEAKINVIDWCADHHYQKFWAPICLSRNDIEIRSGLIMRKFLTFPVLNYFAYPLTLLRALSVRHRSCPSLKQLHKDQSELRLTACGKELTENETPITIGNKFKRVRACVSALEKILND